MNDLILFALSLIFLVPLSLISVYLGLIITFFFLRKIERVREELKKL